MLESIAFAMGPMPEGGAGGDGASMLTSFLPLILMFVIFWFLLIRPQQKRAKAHKQMINELKRGDRVVTSSGIIGRIMEIDDEQVVLESDTSRIRVTRGAIGALLTNPDQSGDDSKK